MACCQTHQVGVLHRLWVEDICTCASATVPFVYAHLFVSARSSPKRRLTGNKNALSDVEIFSHFHYLFCFDTRTYFSILVQNLKITTILKQIPSRRLLKHNALPSASFWKQVGITERKHFDITPKYHIASGRHSSAFSFHSHEHGTKSVVPAASQGSCRTIWTLQPLIPRPQGILHYMLRRGSLTAYECASPASPNNVQLINTRANFINDTVFHSGVKTNLCYALS